MEPPPPPVLDHDGLAQLAGQPLGHDTSDDVGGAAGGEGHDQANGFAGVGVGGHGGRAEAEAREGGGQGGLGLGKRGQESSPYLLSSEGLGRRLRAASVARRIPLRARHGAIQPRKPGQVKPGSPCLARCEDGCAAPPIRVLTGSECAMIAQRSCRHRTATHKSLHNLQESDIFRMRFLAGLARKTIAFVSPVAVQWRRCSSRGATRSAATHQARVPSVFVFQSPVCFVSRCLALAGGPDTLGTPCR